MIILTLKNIIILKILNENSDVSSWVTYKSYKTSRYGMDWCNFLINK